VRTGIGYDAHQLQPNRRLVIGGVHIPAEWGAAGHSDGDVLYHAAADAVLGAAALGDIGIYFPSSDPEFEGMDSRLIIAKARDLAVEKGLQLENLDATVVLESPKLSDHLGAMRENLAAVFEVGIDRISVKATTTDHLGFIGRGEGLAAIAAVLLITP